MDMNDFNEEQIKIINECKARNIDTSNFTPDIDPFKMRLIYLAHGDDINLLPYVYHFDHDQLDEIRLGLKAKLDVGEYADPDIPAAEMHMKRIALEDQTRLN